MAGRQDKGSVTAEFAAVFPAVVLLLASCLVGFQVAGAQLRLQDAAAMTARSLGRGAEPGQLSTMPGLGAVALSTWTEGEVVCVRLAASASAAGIVAVPLAASSCALSGGL